MSARTMKRESAEPESVTEQHEGAFERLQNLCGVRAILVTDRGGRLIHLETESEARAFEAQLVDTLMGSTAQASWGLGLGEIRTLISQCTAGTLVVAHFRKANVAVLAGEHIELGTLLDNLTSCFQGLFE